jgi:hypothetical protein
MFITIAGIIVASLTAAYSALTGDGSARKKTALVSLALVGFVVGTLAAIDSDNKSKAADAAQTAQNNLLQSKLSATEMQLKLANDSLDSQQILLTFVNNSVSQLSKLNSLGGTQSYYVRLAFGQTSEELKRYEDALARRFPGGKTSGLVSVRPTTKPNGFELIFGTGLTLVSAEVFQRLALDQGFANGRPEIRADK